MVRYRRWRSKDGLVHGTHITRAFDGLDRPVFFRGLVCQPNVYIETDDRVYAGATVDELDVADEPAHVNCLGCMGGY